MRFSFLSQIAYVPLRYETGIFRKRFIISH
nr:MAG TPA: hypothetical protein [Herelleviridae sp.]